MAIGWLAAFKAIPWADAIAATPAVVKGARKLIESVRSRGAPAEADAPAEAGDFDTRLARTEARAAQLQSRQEDALALLAALAEQQEKLVAAVEVLRLRSRLLMWLCGALALILAALSLQLLI